MCKHPILPPKLSCQRTEFFVAQMGWNDYYKRAARSAHLTKRGLVSISVLHQIQSTSAVGRDVNLSIMFKDGFILFCTFKVTSVPDSQELKLPFDRCATAGKKLCPTCSITVKVFLALVSVESSMCAAGDADSMRQVEACLILVNVGLVENECDLQVSVQPEKLDAVCRRCQSSPCLL